MIKYQVEKITEEFVEESRSLLEDHWEEIAMYKDKIVFDPDYDKYFQMDELAQLHIVTVRDEGVLVGYFISFVSPHPHYRNDLFASNDILFIKKEYRGSTVAYRMFKFAKKELKSLGVSVMLISMKAEFPFEELCEGLGMDKHEITYSEYIGG